MALSCLEMYLLSSWFDLRGMCVVSVFTFCYAAKALFPTGTGLFGLPSLTFLACRERQASIALERYFRFEISMLSILCMLIARKEMGTSRVSGDSDIIT